ncbi:MAG: choice-of-anchor Q domain-containing protein, partial [Verrucomicrobiota bacterium]
YTIGGTNNGYVVGTLSWTNALTGGNGGRGVTGFAFTITNLALGFGGNVIQVTGTNALGDAVSDSVTITRGRLLDDGGATPIHYVSTHGAHIWPYTNWSMAATVFQHAVDAAMDGDTVLVSNGVYATGGATVPGFSLANRVMVTNVITVRSVNGPEVTIIKGEGPEGSNATRCVYLDGAVLSGFTLTHGHTRVANGPTIHDESGGGVFARGFAVVTNCVFVGNRAGGYGGGANLSGHSRMVRCTLEGNVATSHDGGGVYGGRLYNCLVRGNYADEGGGGVDGGGVYNNCTIVDNTAGERGGGAAGGTFTNCIVYNNRDAGGSNYIGNLTFSYSCTIPLPAGPGNITNAPYFIDANSLNYRLQSVSPCINAGTNQMGLAGAADLDGQPRIIEGVVDMGAYEYPLLRIDITNLNDHVSSDVTTYTIGGSNNAFFAGSMWWTNSAGGGGLVDE